MWLNWYFKKKKKGVTYLDTLHKLVECKNPHKSFETLLCSLPYRQTFAMTWQENACSNET